MQDHLVILDGCSVSLGGRLVLQDIHFRLRPGERWVFMGSNGSGKTSLLRLIRGELHPAQYKPGTRNYALGGPAGHTPIAARRVMSLVSAESQDARNRLGLNVTAEQVVLSGFTDSMYPPSAPTEGERRKALAALEQLGALKLADKRLPSMSRGQGRITLLARALVTNPKVLLLDEFLDGLDSEAQRAVVQRLGQPDLAGTAIILTSHRPDRLPDYIDQALFLEQGRITRAGSVSEIAEALDSPPARFNGRITESGQTRYDYLVRVRNADIRREGRDVLKDVNLDIRPGEHWAVIGANGAGKSSLLLLLMAKLRPLPGGSVKWFGPENPADAFEIRKRIGFISPEIQAGYTYDVDAMEFVLSGFDSSIGFYREPLNGEVERARNLIAMAGLQGSENRRIRSFSYGQLRRLFVARALAPNPALLLMDEAASGLDPAARTGLAQVLDHAAASGTSIVFATHHEDDLPGCINRMLNVRDGRVDILEAAPK